jgi:hypothetical protein
MKKSTLALSVAAAIGSFGLIGNAFAMGELLGAPADTALQVNKDGIGHQLVVPYFTAQSGNATLLNITNTDVVNGKVVKVRFRGAANSDDLFDFTLLLSPGDVWTGGVTQDATTGVAKLASTDTSCVLPAEAKSATGALFLTGRVDPTPAKGSAANETREGYVEIINMADVPPTGGAAAYALLTTAQKAATLYGTTKHANGVAACDGAVLEAKLGADYALYADAIDATKGQMAAPTGKLSSDWIVLNQTNTSAWSGSATALQVVDTTSGAGAAGKLVFWPQKNGAPLLAKDAAERKAQVATADPILAKGVVAIQNYDLPDLSTPYVVTDLTAIGRADATSKLLAVTSVSNQFVSKGIANAVTDLLFTQPTRRYNVAVNYKATAAATNTLTTSGALASPVYRSAAGDANFLLTTAGLDSRYYTAANTTLTGRQVCFTTIPGPGKDALFDREETTTGSSFVISPGEAAVFNICGEAAVASINAGSTGSALNATVVRNDITFAAAYNDGWVTFNTANPVGVDAGFDLPVLGSAFLRLANGPVNYGFTWAHKVTRYIAP